MSIGRGPGVAAALCCAPAPEHDHAPIFAHDHPLLFDGYQPQSDI